MHISPPWFNHKASSDDFPHAEASPPPSRRSALLRVLPSRRWEATLPSPSEPQGSWGLWREPRPQSELYCYSMVLRYMVLYIPGGNGTLPHGRELPIESQGRIGVVGLGGDDGQKVQRRQARKVCLGLAQINTAENERRDPKWAHTSFRAGSHQFCAMGLKPESQAYILTTQCIPTTL